MAAAVIATVSAAASWIVATRWQSPAISPPPTTLSTAPTAVTAGGDDGAAALPVAKQGFATPEACFAAYQEAMAADDIESMLACFSDEMVRIAAAQVAFELQLAAARESQSPPGVVDLMKKHHLDDLDVMGMLQVADSPGGDGPTSVFRAVGAVIAEPKEFILKARQIMGKKDLPVTATQGDVVILQIEGDHAVGQLKEGDQAGMPIHFARDAAGWQLSLPPEVERISRPERSLPPRERRDDLRAEYERQEQIREQNREVHEATFAAAWLFGQTTGKFDMLATGEDRRTIAGGVIAPVYVRFEGSETPILLSSLSEADAALYLEVPYAERHSAVPALIVKSPDANGITRYSNRQGTDVTFQYGQLKYFSSNSPFIEYGIVRDGPVYTMPMTLEQAEKLFGRPLSKKSDRDPRP